jgi:hypothetical protein
LQTTNSINLNRSHSQTTLKIIAYGKTIFSSAIYINNLPDTNQNKTGENFMAKTKTLYTRAEPQATHNDGLAFGTRAQKPKLTREQALEMLNAELQKGEDSLNNEPLLTVEESRRLLGL